MPAADGHTSFLAAHITYRQRSALSQAAGAGKRAPWPTPRARPDESTTVAALAVEADDATGGYSVGAAVLRPLAPQGGDDDDGEAPRRNCRLRFSMTAS